MQVVSLHVMWPVETRDQVNFLLRRNCVVKVIGDVLTDVSFLPRCTMRRSAIVPSRLPLSFSTQQPNVWIFRFNWPRNIIID